MYFNNKIPSNPSYKSGWLLPTVFQHVTSVRLLPTVYSGMCLQTTRCCESLLTLLISIRLLPTVYSGMCLQTTRCSESLLTLLISIRLLHTVVVVVVVVVVYSAWPQPIYCLGGSFWFKTETGYVSSVY